MSLRAIGDKVGVAVATGFGLGLSPVAPGTVGALLGVPLALAVIRLPPGWGVAACVLLALLAVPACEVAERRLGVKDDHRICADEYLTFPICMLGLPAEAWVVALAFLSSRAFDILKPPPARQLQALHGGVGIVIDDVIASVYSLAFNHAAVFVAVRWVMPLLPGGPA